MLYQPKLDGLILPIKFFLHSHMEEPYSMNYYYNYYYYYGFIVKLIQHNDADLKSGTKRIQTLFHYVLFYVALFVSFW